MMKTVQISAHKIQWPGFCACCCGQADGSLEISYTRVKYLRYGRTQVKRTDPKSWSVPYCRRCLAHLRADRVWRWAIGTLEWVAVVTNKKYCISGEYR